MPAYPNHAWSACDSAPYRLSGVVYRALLNDPRTVLALGDAARQPPYKAPPIAPVLCVQPRNTLADNGQPLHLPADASALQTGPTLGIVIGQAACRVPAAQALGVVAGYLLANAFSLPLASHYRPAVRLLARDGFCPLGRMVPASALGHPDALPLHLQLDGHSVWQGHTGHQVRGVAQLVADVTEFMTLQAGDVLLLGVAADAPLARAGQTVTLTAPGLAPLTNPLVGAPA
jgi:5-oxopent-3-ene-1,2,5-tricarboxylate decarboxylase/2-hydroxyhepta-2,4-diene-1,7-dioate isomerase